MAWSVTNEDVRTVRYTSGETSEVLYKDSTKATSFYEDVVCVEFSSDYNQNRDWANREFRIYSYCGPWFECTNPVATSRQDLIDKLNALLATNATITIAKNGVTVAAEPTVNFIEGSNITLTVADNILTDSIDVTIDASGGGGGTVTAVTGTSPITSSGGTTPIIGIPPADALTDGYLSQTDWTIFNSKGNGTVTNVTATSPITSSGGATPDISSQVAKGKLIGRNSVTAGVMEEITVSTGLTLSGTTLSANGVTAAALTKTDDTNVTLTLGGTPSTALLVATSLTLGWTGTLADSRIASASVWNAKQNAITTGSSGQYFRGDLSLATFPTIPTVGTWGVLNYPTWTTGTPFVKMTAAGTFALDTNTYLTSAVTSVTGTAPVVSSGGATPDISMAAATTSVNGYLSSTDWNTFNNKVGGSGTTSYVPRFSASGTIASGVIQDNATNVGVNVAPSTTYKLQVSSPSTVSPQIAIRGTSASVGVDGYASNDDGTVIGVQGYTTDNGNPFASLNCIGGKFTGFGGGNFNYSVQLQDGTEGINKVLLSATADGKANWSELKTVNSNSLIGSGNISVGTVTSVAALTLGTAGTDLGSSVANGSTTPVITLNVPTASATNRGVLSSADWTTFNGKQTSPWAYRQTGRWWTPSVNQLAIGSLTNAINSIRYSPFIVERDITVTQLGIAVVTSGGASTTCRLGIYSNDPTTTKPLTRLVDSGTLALDSTGVKSATGLSVVLAKGLYWFAYFSNASTGTITSIANLNLPDVIGTTTLNNGPVNIYSQSLTYTSLPATAGTLVELIQASSYCIYHYY